MPLLGHINLIISFSSSCPRNFDAGEPILFLYLYAVQWNNGHTSIPMKPYIKGKCWMRKLHLFVVLKHVFVNYCNKGSQATQVGSHGIEASYITVHSYDILVVNTECNN